MPSFLFLPTGRHGPSLYLWTIFARSGRRTRPLPCPLYFALRCHFRQSTTSKGESEKENHRMAKVLAPIWGWWILLQTLGDISARNKNALPARLVHAFIIPMALWNIVDPRNINSATTSATTLIHRNHSTIAVALDDSNLIAYRNSSNLIGQILEHLVECPQ
ncbi:hypothetical protein EDB89DRAFT_39022 [Lactarius sanguifluus]|nr:hypothetical protein EDB89DRAFT_39022 [Lactarius sanguifluus]